MIVAETSFAAVDFESAGICRGSTEVPVQIGIARMHHLEISETFSSFLFTDQPITWAAKKVHGISAKDLAGAPRLPDLWPEINRSCKVAGSSLMVPLQRDGSFARFPSTVLARGLIP